ncbi:hypothetical protein ACU6W1_05950 [Weissella cibaria]|uniref:hypothetical protein n=1 Tax=Weissella cibaria TaxID=137591 RepID=UPI0022E49A22|nr:hypothetical protein [Weissella cibaria]
MSHLKKQKLYHGGIVLLLSIVVGLVPILQLWRTGLVYSGSDLQFHVNRIDEVANSFSHGQFFNILSFTTSNQLGSSVNMFYPYVTLIPAVIIKLIIHNPVNAFYISVWIYNVSTFLIAYLSFKNLSKSSTTGIWGALLLSMSMYRLFSLLGTSAFGEFIAIGLLPLVGWGYNRAIIEHKWGTLYVAVTLIAYTHLLSFCITVSLLVVITLVRWLLNARFSFAELLTFIKAGVAMALSWSPFLIPYLILTKNNHIETPYSTLVFQSLKPFNALLFDYHFSRDLGLILVIANILFIVLWKKFLSVDKLIFGGGCLLVFLSSAAFPWSAYTETFFKSMQFPYRFLAFAVVILSYTGGLAIAQLLKGKQVIYRITTSMILLFITVSVTLATINTYKASVLDHYQLVAKKQDALTYSPFAHYAVNKETFDNQTKNAFITYGGLDYWTRKASDHRKFFLSDDVHLQKKYLGNRTIQFTLLNTQNRKTVEIPIIYYSGIKYSVKGDNKPLAYSSGKNGGLLVHSKEAGVHRITVTSHIGWLESILGLTALLPMIPLALSKWRHVSQ